MTSFLSINSESILTYLLNQSISSIPLFLFVLIFSILFPYKYPKAQYNLWFLFLLRYIFPLDYIVTHYLTLTNPIALITIPTLHFSAQDLFIEATIPGNAMQPSFQWAIFIIYAWLTGLVFLLVRYFYLHHRICQIQKNSSSVIAASHKRRLNIWRRRLGIQRTIHLKFSDVTQSAFNMGLVHPQIILPLHYQHLSLAKLDLIIGHECMHIKRFDNLQLSIQYAVRSVYFFNPLIWLANRFLHLSREQICDTSVIQQAHVPAQFYGNILLDSLYQPGIAGLNSGFNINQFLIKQRLLTLSRSQNMSRTIIIFLIISSLALSAFSLENNIPGSTQEEPKIQENFAQPIKKGRISSRFGMRMHPILKVEKKHDGIDIAAPTGTPIYASADGLVSFAERKGGYGRLIIIDHANGFQTLYSQLSEMIVTSDDHVKSGQLIGLVGNSGLSTAPHLHYEIRKNSEPIDPLDLIKFVF